MSRLLPVLSVLLGAVAAGAALLTLTTSRKIMDLQSDLSTTLDSISDQLDRASTELTNEIATLQNEVANLSQGTGVSVSPELQASIDRLKAIAQKLDDVNPDAPAPVPAPEPAPEPEPPVESPAPAPEEPVEPPVETPPETL